VAVGKRVDVEVLEGAGDPTVPPPAFFSLSMYDW
jgi:hypothetical protein